MNIKVNGEERKLNSSKDKISLYETLSNLGYKKNTIIVELNNLIVNSDEWHKKNVGDGDKLEIVSIVGGG